VTPGEITQMMSREPWNQIRWAANSGHFRFQAGPARRGSIRTSVLGSGPGTLESEGDCCMWGTLLLGFDWGHWGSHIFFSQNLETWIIGPGLVLNVDSQLKLKQVQTKCCVCQKKKPKTKQKTTKKTTCDQINPQDGSPYGGHSRSLARSFSHSLMPLAGYLGFELNQKQILCSSSDLGKRRKQGYPIPLLPT
jgi:hypothetical protein